MPARLHVQQLVERVAVGQPGGPFLIGREQIAEVVERQRDREANAGGQHLPPREIGRHLQDRAALARADRSATGPVLSIW